MTDLLPLNSHTAPPVAGLVVQAAPAQDFSLLPGDELEDYTIKCICGFEEDDGNTVYCDKCDTWQHTECYYVDEHGAVPTNEDLKQYDHFCADCQPRSLDARSAIERQRGRKKELVPGDRKVKKTTTKSHKKKIRLPESNGSLTNGWANGADTDLHDRTSRSPRDPHPPAKKPKTNRRFSNSMNFPLPQNTTSHSHKRSGSTIHSPLKTHSKYSPDSFAKEPYSVDFLHLYDNDPGDASMQTNLLSDIDITRDLGNWSNDVDELEKATNGLSPCDVFNRCEQPVASMSLPRLNKEDKQDEDCLIRGQYPRWKYLTIDSFRPKDSVVAELKGKVGHMQRYIQDPANRWDYLRHPAPFVFFHPKLPIYIDTRSEGTTCRYLRRSCLPNLSMKTFLENGSEYHFCFVAKQDLYAGSELTIGWVLDEHIRNYFSSRNHEDVKLEGDLDDKEYVADWVGKVLAEFGGCACNSPDTCALAKYERRITGRAKGRNGYSGKQSPPDTDYATNSRDSSEQDDRRSSSVSKSNSREMTPTHNSSGDLAFGAGLEISDREKRKIAALEKNFEQLENDKHQPTQKKKKRNSGGSTINTPSVGTSKHLGHTATSFSQPNTPGLPPRPQYADASTTSRRKSGSPTAKSSNPVGRPRSNTVTNSKKKPSQPNTPLVPSPLVRQNYVSSSMQTEPDEEDVWYRPPAIPVAKKPYMSLKKRLLLRSRQDRAILEERRRASLEVADNKTPSGQCGTGFGSVDASQEHVNTEMQDFGPVQISTSTSTSTSMNIAGDAAAYNKHHPDRRSSFADHLTNAEIRPPPPWPAVEHSHPVNGYRANDLQVQLPPKPSLSSDSALNTPLVETPTYAVPQSHFMQNPVSCPPSFSHPSSNVVQPSPIKKKVSLGEYFSRRKGSQPATELLRSSSPTMQQGALKPSSGMNGDIAMQGSAIVDTPKKEESDPLASGESKDLNL